MNQIIFKMTYIHKRTGGRELITLCGKRYNVLQDINIVFYWKDVTCPKCIERRTL